MRESILWAILVLAIAAVAILAYFASKATTNEIATERPFPRDNHCKVLEGAHPSVGWWSRDSDRRSFLAGYEAAYRQVRVQLDQGNGSNPNTLAAYRDFISAGLRLNNTEMNTQISVAGPTCRTKSFSPAITKPIWV